MKIHKFVLRSFGMLLLMLCLRAVAVAHDIHPSMKVIGPATYMKQELYCDAAYKGGDCTTQIKMVLQRLRRYPLEQLGPWTWILVRSQTWPTLTESLGLDSGSPAFTSMEERTTFLEESLIAPTAPRGAELLRGFQTPLEKLLDLAIAHELGHAICNVEMEGGARTIGERLVAGEEADCASLHGRRGKDIYTMKDGDGHSGK
jgi:hypothetical protein